MGAGAHGANEMTVDYEKLAQALRDLVESTKDCTDDELQTLWQRGLLPTGPLAFVRACRVRFK